jgi:hypothetical protein
MRHSNRTVSAGSQDESKTANCCPADIRSFSRYRGSQGSQLGWRPRKTNPKKPNAMLKRMETRAFLILRGSSTAVAGCIGS